MEYKGKLYGKVGTQMFPLEETTEDISRLKAKIKELESKLLVNIDLVDIVKCYTEKDMDNAYDKGFKDGN